jgi:hypothetical protein
MVEKNCWHMKLIMIEHNRRMLQRWRNRSRNGVRRPTDEEGRGRHGRRCKIRLVMLLFLAGMLLL